MHKGGTLEAKCGDRKGIAEAAKLLLVTVLGLCVMSSGEESGLPSSRISPARRQQYSDLAVNWMQQYLRIDTTNPPGNELKTADFFKKIFDQEGIENQLFEYAPGRADLWARIPASAASAS